MKIIGLTGGTGSGKGFVSERLKKRNAYVMDADKIAHEIIEKDKPAYKEIVDYFGRSILDESGCIIRRKLGDIVFSDSEKLAFLNKCTHKYINMEIMRIIDEVRPQTDKYTAIVIDAPLLAEAGLTDICDDICCLCRQRGKSKTHNGERLHNGGTGKKQNSVAKNMGRI